MTVKRNLAYDMRLRRPGCVLLQAAMGGDSHLAQRFPVESWLLAPTPDLKVFSVTEEQLQILIARAERKEYLSERGSLCP